jgi:hypothetical protein
MLAHAQNPHELLLFKLVLHKALALAFSDQVQILRTISLLTLDLLWDAQLQRHFLNQKLLDTFVDIEHSILLQRRSKYKPFDFFS